MFAWGVVGELLGGVLGFFYESVWKIIWEYNFSRHYTSSYSLSQIYFFLLSFNMLMPISISSKCLVIEQITHFSLLRTAEVLGMKVYAFVSS